MGNTVYDDAACVGYRAGNGARAVLSPDGHPPTHPVRAMTFRHAFALTFLSTLLFPFMPDALAQQAPDEPPGLFQRADATRQSLQAQGSKRLAVIEDVPTTASVRLVRLAGNLASRRVLVMEYGEDETLAPDVQAVFQSEDAQRARPQGRSKVKLFIRRDEVEVLSSETYAWMGTVLARPPHPQDQTEDDSKVGEATFIYRKGGHVTGTIRVKGQVFKVRSLDNGLHALVEVDERKTPAIGGSPLQAGSNRPTVAPRRIPRASSRGAHVPRKQQEQPVCRFDRDATETLGVKSDSRPSASCSRNVVRALVVYTAAAAQGRNMDDLIALTLQEANQAYSSSSVYNLDIALAHSQQVDFSETFDIARDVSRLINHATVQALRDQHEADVVVLLTDAAYGGVLGQAREIRAEAGDAYAIVVADQATGELYVFAHEVGHLQGGQHHPADGVAVPGDPSDDPEGDLFPYAFGHRFSERDCVPFWPFCHRDYYATVMSYTPGDYAHIRRFSNPNVEYDGEDTGTSTRYNARALRNTASTMAQFRGGADLYASVGLSIDPQFPSRYTFTAQPCGGNGSYSYEWRISYEDPFSYGGIVSTQQSFVAVLPAGAHYVQLTVRTSTGQVATTVQSVYVSGDCGSQIICQESLATADASASQAAVLPESFALHAVYPNPFSRSTQVAFDLPEASDVRLVVYDVLGREVAHVTEGSYRAGTHRVRFEAGRALASGVYVLRLTAGAHVLTRQVVLVK